MRYEMRRQEPEGRGETRPEVSRAEHPDDVVWAVTWAIRHGGRLLSSCTKTNRHSAAE